MSAVAHWWGITGQTVTKWRKAMGVGTMTESTSLLKSASVKESPALAAACERGRTKDRDPVRCAKIAGRQTKEEAPQACHRGHAEGAQGILGHPAALPTPYQETQTTGGVMSENRSGDIIDGWRLKKVLGKGGNGKVWLAERGATEAALKLLKTDFLDPDHKRFVRFRDEAQTHARLAPRHAGLLPILAHSVPTHPTRETQAWLATPIAIPIKTSLDGKPLTDAVRAVLAVADTLAGLHAEGVSHRDIKPSNLYQFQGRWVVGDLGLVDFPEKDAITDTGERLGPMHYFAPEMLDEGKRADGTKADVYCLAKTLWVLATEQNHPPGGEFRADNSQFGIGAFRPHPRARQLDSLIERATRHDPALRPTMADFASELRAWLVAPEIVQQSDLAQLLTRLREQTAPIANAQAARREKETQAASVVARLRELLQPLGAAFAATSLSSGEIALDTSISHRLVGARIIEPVQTMWESGLVIKASVPATAEVVTRPRPIQMQWLHLTCEVSVELRSDATIRLAGGFLIGTMFGIDYQGVSTFTAPLDSATLDSAIVQLVNDLNRRLPLALDELRGWIARKGEPPPRGLRGRAAKVEGEGALDE